MLLSAPRKLPALAGAVITLLAGAGVAAGAAPASAVPATSHPAATAVQEPPEPVSAALAEAKKTQEPVAVSELTDEYSTTSANPNGTLTRLSSSAPQRVRRNNTWVPIDTSLVKGKDGKYSPEAALSNLSVSAGETTDLLTLKDGANALTFSWPEKLPKASVSGDTATYPGVLPGVDLQITADATGYSSIFVVKDATAAANPDLEKLEFGLTGTNVKIAETSNGGATATDTRSGEEIFRTDTALMWDSSPASNSTAPAVPAAEAKTDPEAAHQAAGSLGGRRARIDVDISAGKQTLTLDKALLTGKDTKYPVYVDPYWSGGSGGSQLNWARISSNGWNVYNSTSKTGATKARIGLDDWPGGAGERARTYYRMNTSDIRGAEITAATLYVTHTWSASCYNTAAVVYATKPVSKWNSTGLSWGKEPAKIGGELATVNAGRVNCGTKSEKVNPPTLKFNVVGYARSAIRDEKLSSLTFRVEAKNMDDKYSWKQLAYGGGATLSVTYSFRPYWLNSTGNQAIKPAVQNLGKLVTTTPTPTLYAEAGNRTVAGITEKVRIQYQIYKTDRTTRLHHSFTGFHTKGEAWRTPALPDGEYSWRATAQNESLFWSATFTPWQNFVVDTKIPAEPEITSTQFPRDQVGGAYSDSGRWLLDNDRKSNTVGYLFTLDGDLSNVVYATTKGTPWVAGTVIKPGTVYFAKADNGNGTGTPVLNGTAAPVFAPAKPGAHVLRAKAVNQGGSTSLQKTYPFNAGTSTPVYATGDKLLTGWTATNTDSTTTTVPPATTTSATGKLTSQAAGTGYYFMSGYQAMLANTSSTSKVAAGDTATFSFHLPKSGVWDFGANLTMASDYGTYSLTLDKGTPSETVLIDNFDAYNSRVKTAYLRSQSIKTPNGDARRLDQGAHTLTLKVLGKNAASGGFQAGIDVIRLSPTPSCSINYTADCLNNTAISTYTAGATPAVTVADADGDGYSYEAADFKAAGWLPDSTVTINGAAIKLPKAFGNGAPDNMLASGQIIEVPSTGVVNKGTALVFVGFATQGNVSDATGSITYAPGSCGSATRTVGSYTIDFTGDWNTMPASDMVLNFPRRNRNNATQVATAANLFAVSVPLKCPGATVESLTLPVVTNAAQNKVPALHFVGLGVRPTSITDTATHWVGSWAAAQDTATVKSLLPDGTAPTTTLNAQTIRIPALLSIGTDGDSHRVRVRLANSLGKTPVSLRAASIALQKAAGTPAAESTPIPLTFRGSPATTLPAGTDVISDPVDLSATDRASVLVSLQITGTLATVPGHQDGRTPIYLTASDNVDHTGDQAGASFTQSAIKGIPLLSGIDVTTSATKPAGAVALFGDQTVNSDTATEDGRSHLDKRLAEALGAVTESSSQVPMGVLNIGTSSRDNRSPLPSNTWAMETNAKAQIDRGILNQSNVRAVLLSAGATDLLNCTATAEVCAETVQTKLTTVASQLHQYKTDDALNTSVSLPNPSGSLKVYTATIPPFTTTPTAAQESARLLVNSAIRGSLLGFSDGVIDFSEAVSAGIEEGSTATVDTVNRDYLTINGTTTHPNDLYYETLAARYVTDSDLADWHAGDQGGGTEDGAESIAVWEFDDARGTTAADTGIGTGANHTRHPATLTDVTWGTSRRIGASAGKFNGTSSFATTDLKPNTAASYTVSAWVKLSDGSADRTIFARGSAGNASMSMTYKAASKRWAVEIPDAPSGDAVTWTVAESDTEAKVGIWTHLAATYDAETSTLSLLVNGSTEHSLTSIAPFNDPSGATWIGRNKDTFFAGQIAGVRVWARTVAEAEFEQHVASIEVLDWELNWTGPATEAEDNTGFGNAGTLVGGASYSCPGHADFDECAVHLDGIDGSVTRDAVLHTDQSFSVSAWARPTKTGANYAVVGQDGSHASRFLLQWNSAANNWQFLTTSSDDTAPTITAAAAPAGTNEWTHLVGVYDAAGATLSLYVDGELKQTVPAGPSWNATGEFAVGRSRLAGTNTNYFPGDIDAVRVYQGAISAEDVAHLYSL
jgi:hypothetical protein